MRNIKKERLTDEHIAEILINYVNEDIYNYAVMIDGAWGCGKTHFVKEYLIKKLEKNEDKNEGKDGYKKRSVVYISLYGVNNINEISRQVLLESYLSKAGKSKKSLQKISKVASAILPLAFDLLKVTTGAEVNSDGISGAIDSVLSVNNSILIFDDLERCDCPINEILGYINTFVEQGGLKVIIVANEGEIGKNQYLNNLELKYMVAANKNIDFEQKPERQNIIEMYTENKVQDEKKGEEPINISNIENRVGMLFKHDYIYEKIKEKLVGFTIYYQPDMKEVFIELLKNKNLDNKLQTDLNEVKDFFREYMIEEKHTNFRTFQFYLSKISVLYKAISKTEGEGKEAFNKYIIQYCFKVCVAYKNNSLKYEWEDNLDYAFRTIGNSDIFGNKIAFKFVDDFIMNSILDENKVHSMLILFEDEYIKKRDSCLDNFRQLEAEWYILEDKEIELHIQEILKSLEKNIYEFKDYPRIISLFLDLEQAGFQKEYISSVIKIMMNNVHKLKEHINLINGYGLLQEGEKKQRYNDILKQLQQEIDQHFKNQISNTLEGYLKMEEDWGRQFKEYIYSNKADICNDSGFLRQIDISKLCLKISESKSKDINNFRDCILSLYVRGVMGIGLEQDEEPLHTLLNEVEKIDTKDIDRIKILQIKYLISNLKSAEKVYSKDS